MFSPQISLRVSLLAASLLLALPSLTAGILEDRVIEDSIQNSFVFRELLADRGMVQTYVRLGRVELRGQVADERERTMISDTISAITGVVAVENRLFVDSAHRRAGDRWLVARVRSQLVIQRELDGSRIEIAVRAGELVLSGAVRNDQQRGLAVALARPFAPDQKLRDEMSVSPTELLETTVDDPSVVAMVRHALDGIASLKIGPTDLASREGNVVIRGSVASPEEIAEVSRRVSSVRGVRSVANHLSAAP